MAHGYFTWRAAPAQGGVAEMRMVCAQFGELRSSCVSSAHASGSITADQVRSRPGCGSITARSRLDHGSFTARSRPPGYPFAPHYVEVGGLRMHDVGEGAGRPVLRRVVIDVH